jgi:hypothetical protein
MKITRFALAMVGCITLTSCSETKRVYVADCKAAPPNWMSLDDFLKTEDGGTIIDYLVNSIRLDRTGRLFWNGTMIERNQLGGYLLQVDKLDPRPLVELRIDNGTACDDVEKIRNTMAQSKICQHSQKDCTEDFSVYEGSPPPENPQSQTLEDQDN